MAKRYVSILAMSLAMLAITGFSTLIVLDSMQYRAIKVDSDRDIDDTFNDLSQDGWYPQFVLNFENNTRLILERPRVEEERIYGLEYRADVVRRDALPSVTAQHDGDDQGLGGGLGWLSGAVAARCIAREVPPSD